MDEEWFDALFRAHAPRVHRYLLRRAPADAEDLAAEVMTIAWRRRADVPAGAELPWLYRTAGHVLSNHRRKRVATPIGHASLASPEAHDVDPSELVIADQAVRAALAALSPRDRRILLLHAWEGLAGEELAAVLGISRGGADAALSRARARLAAAWES